MASPASLMSIPASANATTVLPGSRPWSSTASQVWPNPVPLDTGVIRLHRHQEKQVPASKHGRAGAAAGQKFPPSVSVL